MAVKILFLLLVGYVLTYLYLIFPASATTHSPYFFNPQKITKQAYVDYFCVRVFYIIAALCVKMLFDHHYPDYSWAAKWFLWMFFFYLVDYACFYNQPVGYLNLGFIQVPVSYSMVMGIVLIVVTFKAVIQWYF